jgi:hypothetical protein
VRVVCVHGIGQHLEGERTLLAAWLPALRDGLTRAAASDAVSEHDVGMAFYGDLFRPAGSPLGVGDPVYEASDVDAGVETELLLAWWAEAGRVEQRVVAPSADTLVRTPGSVQAALRALSRSRFWAGVALRAMVFDLKQVRGYLTDRDIRQAARDRVAGMIDDDTRVVVAHSLGTVVAYEALHDLHTRTGHKVRSLVTLGSPLGIANLIFDRLQPPPVGGRGSWPGDDTMVWTNLVDAGDIVALVKDLCARFGPDVRNITVHNGAHAHDVRPYLTDALTGAAIAAGLR